MRWLLLKTILELKKGETARTSAVMPSSETVSPELLLTEMMAQTAGLLMGAEKNFSEDVIFGKIENVLFSDLPEEGAELLIRAASERLHPEGAWFDCSVTSANNIVGSGRLMLMNVGHLREPSRPSITFHENFMRHFRVRELLQVSS